LLRAWNLVVPEYTYALSRRKDIKQTHAVRNHRHTPATSETMIRELTEQDFEKAVKNPHFDKLMTKVEVAVTKEDWEIFCKYAKINGVSPELIMRNGLTEWAKELRDE